MNQYHEARPAKLKGHRLGYPLLQSSTSSVVSIIVIPSISGSPNAPLRRLRGFVELSHPINPRSPLLADLVG